MHDLNESQIYLLEQAVQFERALFWSEAEALYKKILSCTSIKPDGIHTVFSSHYIKCKLAHVLVQRYQWKEADVLLRELLVRDKNTAELWCDMGRVLIELNRVHDGLRACKKALMLKPTLAEAHQHVARAFIYRHEWDKARSTLDRLLKKDPESSASLGLKGYIEFIDNEEVLASDLLNQAIEIDPKNSEAYIYRCVIAIKNHQWETLLVNLESALRMQADLVAMQKMIIMSLVEQEFYEEAEQCLAIMIDHHPDDPLLFVNWAHVLRLNRNYQEALDVIERTLVINANEPAVWVSFIEISMDQCPSNAYQVIDRVVSNNPDNAKLLMFCAHTAFQASLFPLARELTNTVAAIQPDNVMVELMRKQLDTAMNKMSA